MKYEYKDRKIICVVSDELENWQAMNVIGHLALGLGARKDENLMGRDTLSDASGTQHTGIARYGFIIKKGNPASIREVVEAARKHADIMCLDFPGEMLETSHDDELAEQMLKKEERDFEYLGMIVYGPTKSVQELTRGLELWG